MAEPSPRLSVAVKGRPVATLFRERDNYLLQYLGKANDFVSLTMPVRATPWAWPRDLHPFFRQNLPEGYLLQILREVFGPALDGTDLSLLGLVGSRGIGRVTIVPEGASSPLPAEPLDFSALLHTDFNAAHFDSLVRRYACSAVSGVVPKFLAPNETHQPHGRATLRTAKYIVKGSTQHPYLALNEHYSLRVLSRIGKVPVVRTRLSDDGQTLLVERFDVDDEGTPTHGVEDACSLLGRPPHEKYAPSMEEVLKATTAYLPSAQQRAQIKTLAYQILANFLIRNADCHAKNIALYYTSLDDVAYAPAYDMVTTQAYDGFRDHTPGLTIAGRKSWVPGKALPMFFSARLGIPNREYRDMLAELCDSVVSTANELQALAAQNPAWRDIVKNMLWAWDRGMRDMGASESTASLAPIIKQAGFSDYEPPGPLHRTGESPLLGRRRSSPRVRKRTRI